MSDTFCILPWVHSHIKPNGDVHLCSRKSIPLGNVHDIPLDTIFQSDGMNDVRNKMLNGETVRGCEKCYHMEKISDVSLRKLSNWWFKRLLIDDVVEDWKSDSIFHDGTDYNFDWIKEFSTILKTPKIEWLGIHASNICNLACRGCYSMLSSKWKKDEKVLGINPHPLYNINMDEFGIDLTDINFITMFGGEPLIMKQHDQLIDFIDNSDNIHNKILQYFTNGTMLPDEKTINVWKRVKKLQLFISVDGYGDDNDYFRHGSKWDIVESNIKTFIKYANKYDWELRISSLINIYNVDRLDILYNWLVNQGIDVSKINYNLCIIPQELDIRNLPKEYKDKILEIYKTINLPTQLINMVTNHINTEPNIDFMASAAFSDKLDKMRNEDNPNSLLKVYMNDC